MPPITFLEPGLGPRSSRTTCSPAFAIVYAAAGPAGPAPTTIASNFSSSPTHARSPLQLIGLTGGAGSGQSTAAGGFREPGAGVVAPDDAMQAGYEPGTPGV